MRSFAFALLVATMLVASCSSGPRHSPEQSSSVLIGIGLKTLPNKLSITTDNRILWNGRAVSERRLAELLDEAATLNPEPELLFKPEDDADYELIEKVLGIVMESKATKYGFVGHEFYSASDAPSD